MEGSDDEIERLCNELQDNNDQLCPWGLPNFTSDDQIHNTRITSLPEPTIPLSYAPSSSRQGDPNDDLSVDDYILNDSLIESHLEPIMMLPNRPLSSSCLFENTNYVASTSTSTTLPNRPLSSSCLFENTNYVASTSTSTTQQGNPNNVTSQKFIIGPWEGNNLKRSLPQPTMTTPNTPSSSYLLTTPNTPSSSYLLEREDCISSTSGNPNKLQRCMYYNTQKNKLIRSFHEVTTPPPNAPQQGNTNNVTSTDLVPSASTQQGNPSNVTKFIASNISITKLNIGPWARVSEVEGDMRARLYFGRRKIMWEIRYRDFKGKMEIEWSHITAIKAVFNPNQHEILIIQLDQPPAFFKECPPQPRKHTAWQPIGDFTCNHASRYRTHTIMFPRGVLQPEYDKLLRSDPRLFELSQKPFPSQTKIPPYVSSIVSDYNPTT